MKISRPANYYHCCFIATIISIITSGSKTNTTTTTTSITTTSTAILRTTTSNTLLQAMKFSFTIYKRIMTSLPRSPSSPLYPSPFPLSPTPLLPPPSINKHISLPNNVLVIKKSATRDKVFYLQDKVVAWYDRWCVITYLKAMRTLFLRWFSHHCTACPSCISSHAHLWISQFLRSWGIRRSSWMTWSVSWHYFTLCDKELIFGVVDLMGIKWTSLLLKTFVGGLFRCNFFATLKSKFKYVCPWQRMTCV